MGVAGINARFLTLTTSKSTLENKLSILMARRQTLTYQATSISTKKSDAILTQDENKIKYIESIETAIESMDKLLEMDIKKVTTQQQMYTKELEGIEKLLDTNVKKEFKFFANS
jgi:hypothetical protein